MAEGRIKELVDRYEEVRERKERLTKEKSEAETEFKAVQEELATAISDADMSAVQDGEFSYTPGVKTRYSFKSAADLDSLGLDKFAGFEADPRLCDLVTKTINANSMQGILRELADTEEGLPEDVAAVLNTYDEITISRTKTDTAGKNKVKDALKKRRG